MPCTSAQAASILNDLIQTCRDGEKGYAVAENAVADVDLKHIFASLAKQRSCFAGELHDAVRSLGEEPEDHPTAGGALHRGWMNLKKTATTADGGRASVLADCERGEEAAEKHYRRAVENELPHKVRDLVLRQHAVLEGARDRIRDLHEAAEAEP